MENILNHIPKDLINFLLVALFAMLIGLEQRRHHDIEKEKSLLGTDRTFTFIGILGFILYLIDPQRMVFFGVGGLALTFLLGIFYIAKIWQEGQSGLTSIVVALITYCLAPLVYTQPPWLVLLVLVVVLVLVESKDMLIAFSEKFDKKEFITLAKFIAIAGVILPLTPDESIIPGISLTPYKFWLSVVAVSSISYISYLLRKFVFSDAGLLLTGILGGMYSSTATTFTLARKSHSSGFLPAPTAGAIIFATAMMYLRILLLAFIFNRQLAGHLLAPFLVLTVISIGVGWWLFRVRKGDMPTTDMMPADEQQNPLEFKTALLFAVLFVFFAALTHYVLGLYGNNGLQVLSLIVGVTDIDPFLLNLFQDKEMVGLSLAAMATIQATISNNVLKMLYGFALGTPEMRKYLGMGFGAVIVISIVILFFI